MPIDISDDPALVRAGYQAAYVSVDAGAVTKVLRDAALPHPGRSSSAGRSCPMLLRRVGGYLAVPNN